MVTEHDKSITLKDGIKLLTAGKWHQKHTNFNQREGYHCLERADQIILIRLRTGHNRMNIQK